MSDCNCFCQPKFILKGLRWLVIFIISCFLFSCVGDEGAYEFDSYDKTGFTPARYPPPTYRRPSYPTYRGGHPVYNHPYSRVYKNPYEFQHQNPYYPSYYDQDYYYVPPSNYRNIEPDFEFGADQKS